jgi:alkylation response protein AidB-like acyl-CoA dehydrogenase
MSDISFQLNEDQLTLQKWIHDFAEETIARRRPNGTSGRSSRGRSSQEAAKIGLYGIDFMANAMMRPDRLTCRRHRGAVLGRRRHRRCRSSGSGLAAAASAGNGTPEQLIEWVPQCYGDADDVKAGRLLRFEPDAGSDVSCCAPARCTTRPRTSGVLNGTKAWITNGGIANIPRGRGVGRSRAQGPRPGQLHRPAGHQGPVAGPEVQEARHPRVAHRRGGARRRPVPGSCLLGGKEKLDAKLAKARDHQKTGEKQPAMATFESTRPAVAAMAVGIARAAYEYALHTPRSGSRSASRSSMNQAIAFMLADMATEIDAARLLVWRAAVAARNGGYTNAEGSMSKLKAGRTAVWVTERAIQILGGYGYVREYPSSAAPRRQDLRHLRGHRADPAARDQSGHHRPARRVARARR